MVSFRDHDDVFSYLEREGARLFRSWWRPVVGLLAVLAVGRLLVYEHFATCSQSLYGRDDNPDMKGTAWIPAWLRDVVAFKAIPLLAILALVVASLRLRRLLQIAAESQSDSSSSNASAGGAAVSRSSNKTWAHFLQIGVFVVGCLVLALLGVLAAIWLLNHAKNFTQDRECSRKDAEHANGVSGHAMVSVWALVWLWYVSLLYTATHSHTSSAQQQQQQERQASARQASSIWATIWDMSSYLEVLVLRRLFVLGAAIFFLQLAHTLMFAYHTVQQVVLGSMFGTPLATLSVFLAEKLRPGRALKGGRGSL